MFVDEIGGFTRSTIFPVTVDRHYLVYALTVRRGGVWYYILDDRNLGYPVWHPAALFVVRDGRLSRHWKFALEGFGIRDGDVLFAFPEWVESPHSFYDRLSDGDASATATFAHYRTLMETEFDWHETGPAATPLGDGWMMCPECQETWLTSAVGELIKCPRCATLLKNPSLVQ